MSKPAHRSVHTLAATTHGRYVVRRAVDDPPRGILVGFHGYGQEAEAFVADVESIPGAEAWLVVSVQGLHRFYTRSGDIVASWMTSQDRDLAIADNLSYVRAVLDRVGRDEALPPTLPVVYLGFSQGAAMAYRAAAHAERRDGVIALGGDVPPEVRAARARVGPVLVGRGLRDEWYKRDTFERDLSWLRETSQLADLCEYDAGHVWTDAFRGRASAFLDRVGRAAHGDATAP